MILGGTGLKSESAFSALIGTLKDGRFAPISSLEEEETGKHVSKGA